MAAATMPRWEDLDPATRDALDAAYRKEFAGLAGPGVPESALDAYLAYRHGRPAYQITTYEQGQIRRMLHRTRRLDAIPDPVEAEDHRDAIERYGARKLHLTNGAMFLAVLFVHVYAGLLAVLLWLLLRAS